MHTSHCCRLLLTLTFFLLGWTMCLAPFLEHHQQSWNSHSAIFFCFSSRGTGTAVAPAFSSWPSWHGLDSQLGQSYSYNCSSFAQSLTVVQLHRAIMILSTCHHPKVTEWWWNIKAPKIVFIKLIDSAAKQTSRSVSWKLSVGCGCGQTDGVPKDKITPTPPPPYGIFARDIMRNL